ncbi:MAG TPA: acyloxyacyl hydrolase [Gemmatimonadaceae bacterium]
MAESRSHLLRAPTASLVALLLALAAPAGAQRAMADSAARRAPAGSTGRFPFHPASVEGWVGMSRHSSFRTRLGVPLYRDFYISGIRASWPLGAQSRAVEYFVDLIPAAISTDMPDYGPDDDCVPGEVCPDAHPVPHTVYAVGLAPLGIAVRVAGGRRARLELEGSAGALWFTRTVPDPAATRFNFTAAAGAALDLAVSRDHAVRLGYLFHHTSNGGRGLVNPGLNSQVVTLGIAWRRE